MSTRALRALPDSETAVAAMRLAESSLPEFVYHHSIRGYLYGRELADQQGLRAGHDYDEELLFLCNVLHDLGLSTAESRPERFEVDGAYQAVDFARSVGLAEEKLDVLWDAVALHTSAGIAGHKCAEVAITHLGVSADILGFGRERLPAELVDAVHDRYPRQDLGYALTERIVAQARLQPEDKAGPLTFPGHLLDLHSGVARARTWFDVLAHAGWGDRPVSGFATEGAASPEELATEFVRRMARRDVDGMALLYDVDAVLVSASGGVARGRDEIRAALAELIDAGAVVELEPQFVHVAGDQALVADRATIRSPEGVQTVMATEVCRRRADGRWFYLVDDPTFVAAAGEVASTAAVEANPDAGGS
jgi:uncharacterized protein (TIGR02246 family)